MTLRWGGGIEKGVFHNTPEKIIKYFNKNDKKRIIKSIFEIMKSKYQ